VSAARDIFAGPGDRVTLAHGGGGRAMRRLIEGVLLPAFGNSLLAPLEDQARISMVELAGFGDRLAFTTDTYVVSPIEFPGGDIGRLAVFGTVNDLAMAGARPLYLSCGLVLEEGLEMSVLARVAKSMGRAAREAGVKIVTGDTKVRRRHSDRPEPTRPGGGGCQ
jgi:hydrogenase expression/formation protein HypE